MSWFWWCSLVSLLLFVLPGCDSAGEELPEAHGVLNAADPAHRVEHPYRKCCLISFALNAFNWSRTRQISCAQ